MAKNIFLSILLAVTAFFADQAIKNYCKTEFLPNQSVYILGIEKIRLTRVMNQGTMFETLSKFPPGENKALTRYAPTLTVILFLILFLDLRGLGRHRWESAFFGLFFGGAVSNLSDHWRSDFVMDTFGVWSPGSLYLLFNFADLCILVGWLGLSTLASYALKSSFSVSAAKV